MWLKTQAKGYVNSDQLLSIGLGRDEAGRITVVASMVGMHSSPAAGGLVLSGVAVTPLAGPFLPDEAGEARALAVLERIVQRTARGAILDPAQVAG